MKKGILIFIFVLSIITLVYAATFSDVSQSDFNQGSYANTTHNGSAIVLSGSNLTGTYISRIFDATSVARWNNISMNFQIPTKEYLYAADAASDVWNSTDFGTTWILAKDDYNGAYANGADTGFFNSSGALYVIYGQRVFVSMNLGATWTKINEDYNGAEGQNAIALVSDKNNIFYIIEGDEDVWKSSDSGATWTKVASNFNGGNGNVAGLVVNNSNVLITVDAASDVWKSSDSGATWTLVKDDYNGAEGNGASALTIDGNNVLYLVDSQKVWKSSDSGATWNVAVSDFDTSDVHLGISMTTDSNNKVYIIDGGEDVYSSSDGTTWTKQASNFNGGNLNAKVFFSILRTTNLTFQVRNCSSVDCSDGSWQTIDLNNVNLTGRYFQYKGYFASQDSSITPLLYNVSLEYTILDNVPPAFSNYAETPANGSSYVSGQIYRFNVTITEANPGGAWIEFNGANYTTGITNVSNVYTFVKTDLSAGTYSYRWWANDTFGNLNSSEMRFYTINKATSQVSLAFDKISPQVYGASINATCFVLSGQGNSVLTLNGNTINSGQVIILGAESWEFNCSLSESQNYTYSENSSSFAIDKANPTGSMNITGTIPVTYGTLSDFAGAEANSGDEDCSYVLDKTNGIYGVGTWTFNYSISGCENYTAGSVTKDLQVNKATPVMSITGNSSIIYGTAADIAATENNNGDADFAYLLYRNGVLISSPDTSLLAAGSYSYIYATSGGQNYTSMGVNFDLVVGKANSATSLIFDKISPQLYGTEINASCSADNPEENVKLYRNNVEVTETENNKNIILPAGTWDYVCNVTESQNYTSAFSFDSFVIEKEEGNIKLYLNGLEDNLTIWSIEESNITATTLYGNVIIYKGGEDITSENGQNLIREAGYYNITAISFGDENHSYEAITRWLNVTEDLASPLVSMLAPQDGDVYGYKEDISLDFLVSDENLQSCWYNLNGGGNVIVDNCENTTFDVAGDGNYTLYLYSNDSYGNQNGLEINFSVSLDSPTIILHFPIRAYLNYTDIIFRYTPSDMDLQSCELWGNFDGSFKLNQTNNAPLNYSENTFELILPAGAYTWNVRCNDSAGHSAFNGNKIFYVDTTAPSITLNEPKGTKTSRIVTSRWGILDASPVSCVYNVYRGLNLEVVNTSANCSLNSTTFNVTVDADFVFNFYVNDSAGNSNSASSSFSVDTSTQQPDDDGGGGGGGGGGSGVIPQSKPNLEIQKIGNLIVDPGKSSRISLGVQNTGKLYLNECKLKGKGKNAGWVLSDKVRGLSIGEKYDFVFTLNVPASLEVGAYLMELEILCLEYNKTTNFTAEMIEKKLAVDLIKVERKNKDSLEVVYSLAELSGYEQDVKVDVVLFGSNNERVAEVSETKSIKADSKQEFTSNLEIPAGLEGSFNLLINAISGTSSAFVQEEVVLGKTELSGMAILRGESGGKIFSIVLIVLFGIFAVFIVRRIWKLKRFRKRLQIQRVHLKK